MIASLRPYEDVKDSGQPWLGPIPSHWAILRGKSQFRRVARPVLENDETVTCFRDGTVTLRRNRRLGGFTEALKEIGYQGIEPGDLVIHAMDAFAGAVGVSDSRGKASPVYVVCEPTGECSQAYAAQVVRLMAHRGWIESLSTGIRERSTDFRYSTFGSQYLPVPPRFEQDGIVRFLDYVSQRIDRAIAAKRKTIALLNEQKQTMIFDAVTRGIDAAAPLKPSGIPWVAEIPAHWQVKRLGAILKERGEFNQDLSVTDVLSLVRTRGVIPYAEKGNIGNKRSDDISRYKIVRPDDIVMNSMNVIIGSVGISRYVGCLSPVYYVLERRSNDDSADYMNAIFQIEPFHKSLIRIGKGILAHRMRIPMELLKAELFPYPEPAEQKRIMNLVNRETAKLTVDMQLLEREIDLLNEYRTRLISDVVTGKVDVREAAKSLPDHVEVTDSSSESAMEKISGDTEMDDVE